MTTSIWTKHRVERLTTLWKEGQTADQVARALGDGVSRSAVLGKVFRMGLSAGRASTSSKVSVPTRAKTELKPAAVRLVRSKSAGQARDGLTELGRATVLTVGRNQCRWPIGDPRWPAFSLCGRSSVRGAYCACHAQLAYRPTGDTPRTLERLAGLL